MPDRFGGESLIIPMEDLCKNDKSLYGTVLFIYTLKINLHEFNFIRANMEDSKLMDYAMGQDMVILIFQKVCQKRWRGSYIGSLEMI